MSPGQKGARTTAGRPWRPPLAQVSPTLLRPEPHGGPRGGETGEILDFSTNVLPFPPDEEVLAAVREARLDRYPDPWSLAARSALSAHWDVPVERLTLAPGASELIHRVAATFLRPGDAVLVAGPAFGEYRRAARLRGATVEELRGAPPGPPEVADLARRIRETGPRLVFVCNPNNPTGVSWPDQAIRRLADDVPAETLLVVDESYRSFPFTALVRPHAPDEDRILHLRSLTKDLALPGLRVAAGVGAPAVLRSLEALAPPWAVGSGAQRAVEAAVRPGPLARLSARLTRTNDLRRELEQGLREVGWSPLSSSTGFVLSRVGGAEDIARKLEDRGIRVRDCTSFGLSSHLRTGARCAADNARLLEALNALEQAGSEEDRRCP